MSIMLTVRWLAYQLHREIKVYDACICIGQLQAQSKHRWIIQLKDAHKCSVETSRRKASATSARIPVTTPGRVINERQTGPAAGKKVSVLCPCLRSKAYEYQFCEVRTRKPYKQLYVANVPRFAESPSRCHRLARGDRFKCPWTVSAMQEVWSRL